MTSAERKRALELAHSYAPRETFEGVIQALVYVGDQIGELRKADHQPDRNPHDLTDLNVHNLVERAVRNAYPWRSPTGKSYRWAAVRDAFGVGSTTAKRLCAAYGLDPDEVIGAAREGGEE